MPTPRKMGKQGHVEFSYMVPVHVRVENGRVTQVNVNDEHPIENPKFVGGDAGDFEKAVRDANAAASWPGWEFGF